MIHYRMLLGIHTDLYFFFFRLYILILIKFIFEYDLQIDTKLQNVYFKNNIQDL